jgi:preprotein translocase subunit SecF
MPGANDDYAIITQGKQLLNVVETVNQKLSDVNQKIQQITESQEAMYNTQSQERNFKTADLKTQFKQLNEERDKINRLSDKYKALDHVQIQTGLTLTQKYYTFVLLALLAIITIYLLYRFVSGSSSAAGLQSGGAMSLLNIGAPAYIILLGMILLTIGIRAKTG